MVNKEIVDGIKLLRDELLNEPIIVSFLNLQHEIDFNEDLIKLSKKIITAKKNMSVNMANDVKYYKYKKEYETLQEEYDTNPLVVNYRAIGNEVYDLLNQVKTIIDIE